MTVQALAPNSYPSSHAEVEPLRGFAGQSGALPYQVGVKVVGGDPLSREGVIRFLQECPDLRLLGDHDASGTHVVVAVVDRVSDHSLQLLQSLRKDAGSRVVLLVGDLELSRAVEVMHAGAVGIIRRRDVSRSALRRVIRSVLAGEAVVPPDVLDALLGNSLPARHRMVNLGVDDREIKVLRLLADGADTREIAQRLCFSERTVKTVIQDIANRFGLRNRSHMVAYAIRQGLI